MSQQPPVGFWNLVFERVKVILKNNNGMNGDTAYKLARIQVEEDLLKQTSLPLGDERISLGN